LEKDVWDVELGQWEGLDKQYKAIKASPAISSILHNGPYGIYYIRKPLNKGTVSTDHIK